MIRIWRYDMSLQQLIYICVLNFTIAVGSLLQIYLLFMSEAKIVPIIKLVETILPSLCFAACYYNILSNTTIMKRILYHIKCDWDNLAHKPELIILKEYANRTRTYTITIAIAFYLYIISLILPSTVRIFLHNFDEANETGLTLPIGLDNFMKDQMNYYLTLLLECVFIFIMSTIGIAHYSITKIEKGFECNTDKLNDASNCNKFAQEYKWLVDIIESFADLMKLYLEKIYPFEVFMSLLFIIVNYIYMPNSILLLIVENAKNITLFHNEEHGAMQFIYERNNRIIPLSFWHVNTDVFFIRYDNL
ncbi:odorant receptor 47a-like [Vespula maculifrons]|uniref:Odorant receptor 47a-like n=1 Tax=Vespula maculifrons TaxID=7453 RepID=A0ABD2BPN5_VESMC